MKPLATLLLSCFSLGCFSLPASAASLEGRADVAAFVERAIGETGIPRADIEAALAAADTKPNIPAIFDRPATSRPWHQFRPNFVNDRQVEGGVTFWATHAQSLFHAATQYGVDEALIVAIIGMESGYGRNTGSFRVLDALATVAFDYPRRAEYFQNELIAFLQLAKEEGGDIKAFRGSYAGAMGWPQFMPSSFRKWAVDFDGDGHRDIWKNPTDVIGSVANYFQQHGWQKGADAVLPARVPSALGEKLAADKFNLHYTIAELRAMGVVVDAPIDGAVRAVVFPLETAPSVTEYWVGLQNFYTITRYNKSSLYAMAAVQLADRIREKRLASLVPAAGR